MYFFLLILRLVLPFNTPTSLKGSFSLFINSSHSPHVANGCLNVANGLISKYFKIVMFLQNTQHSAVEMLLSCHKNVANGCKQSPQLWRTKKYYWTSLLYVNLNTPLKMCRPSNLLLLLTEPDHVLLGTFLRIPFGNNCEELLLRY